MDGWVYVSIGLDELIVIKYVKTNMSKQTMITKSLDVIELIELVVVWQFIHGIMCLLGRDPSFTL